MGLWHLPSTINCQQGSFSLEARPALSEWEYKWRQDDQGWKSLAWNYLWLMSTSPRGPHWSGSTGFILNFCTKKHTPTRSLTGRICLSNVDWYRNPSPHSLPSVRDWSHMPSGMKGRATLPLPLGCPRGAKAVTGSATTVSRQTPRLCFLPSESPRPAHTHCHTEDEKWGSVHAQS